MRYIYVSLSIKQPLGGKPPECVHPGEGPKQQGCQTKGGLKAALWPPERLIAIDCGTGPVARILVQWRHLGNPHGRNPHGRNRPNAGMDDSGIARPGEVKRLSACWFRQSSPGTQRCGRAGVERETRLLFRYPPLSARGGGALSGVQV